MPARSYSVDFEGYWTDVNSLPTAAGIYCAYACIDNQDTVSLSKLLYIGETDDIRGIQGRVKNHEKKAEWKRQLRRNEVLCFNASTTAVLQQSGDRTRIEAAMIFRHKPPCNVEHTNMFLFDRTTVRIMGGGPKLYSQFTVNHTR